MGVVCWPLRGARVWVPYFTLYMRFKWTSRIGMCVHVCSPVGRGTRSVFKHVGACVPTALSFSIPIL